VRREVLLAILLPLFVLPVYAVLINLTSTNIAQLGGTGLVDVVCPASGCSISRVSWVMSTSAPFRVTAVNVQWQTAKTASQVSYTVYVTLYDSSNTIIASGSATQSGSSNPVTTNVPISPSVDPKDVYRVEIVIVET